MPEVRNYKLRPVSTTDIDIVYRWRTQPHVANYMLSGSDITMEQHKKWFHGMLNNDKLDYHIFEHDNKPLGLAYATEIDIDSHTCHWGFYLGETGTPKGTGTYMAKMMIDHIATNFEIDYIYGEVLKFNHASLRIHEKLGFTRRPDLYYETNKNGKIEEVIVMILDTNHINK